MFFNVGNSYMSESKEITFHATPRPGIRYLARTFDIMIDFLLLVGLYTFPFQSLIFENNFFILFSIFLLLTTPLILEAWFHSKFGATPGKWIFCTKVASESGKKLRFVQAFNRMCCMWVNGFGLVILNISS